MDGKYNFTTTDELNLYITARIRESLSHILGECTDTRLSIKFELDRLTNIIQKLEEKKTLKLRGIISRTKKIRLEE